MRKEKRTEEQTEKKGNIKEERGSEIKRGKAKKEERVRELQTIANPLLQSLMPCVLFNFHMRSSPSSKKLLLRVRLFSAPDTLNSLGVRQGQSKTTPDVIKILIIFFFFFTISVQTILQWPY